jgi:hypothetical protein
MPTVTVVKNFDQVWREWLRERGLGMVDVPAGTGEHIAGLCIAFGDSPRGGLTISQHPVSHAVVCSDMELVHDPHPSRAFLGGTPKGYTVFYNLNLDGRNRRVAAPSAQGSANFWLGFAMALASVNRNFDKPTIVKSVMDGYGVTVKMLKNSGVEDHDLKEIRKCMK